MDLLMRLSCGLYCALNVYLEMKMLYRHNAQQAGGTRGQ